MIISRKQNKQNNLKILTTKEWNAINNEIDNINETINNFITTKTVVGEPVKIDANTTIIPLVDVSCGMAAGSFAQSTKTNGGGGLSAKMSPSAILVIQNGMTKLVNIKHQDAMTKSIDMVPDLMNRFMGKDVSADAVAKAEEMKADLEAAETVVVTEEVK